MNRNLKDLSKQRLIAFFSNTAQRWWHRSAPTGFRQGSDLMRVMQVTQTHTFPAQFHSALNGNSYFWGKGLLPAGERTDSIK